MKKLANKVLKFFVLDKYALCVLSVGWMFVAIIMFVTAKNVADYLFASLTFFLSGFTLPLGFEIAKHKAILMTIIEHELKKERVKHCAHVFEAVELCPGMPASPCYGRCKFCGYVPHLENKND